MKPEKELEALIRLVSDVLDAHTAVLFLADESGKELWPKALFSLSGKLKPQVRIPLGYGLVGRVAEDGRPVNVGRLEDASRTLQYYADKEDVKAFMAVPVRQGRKVVGVLCVDSKRRAMYGEKALKVLAGFARQFQLLLERCQEWEMLERKAQKAERMAGMLQELKSIGPGNASRLLLGFARQLLEFDQAVLGLLEGKAALRLLSVWGFSKGEAIVDRVISARQGLLGLTLRQMRPLMLNETEAGSPARGFFLAEGVPRLNFRSFLGLPLTFGGRLVGCLVFLSRKVQAFDEEARELAEVVGFQAGAVLAHMLKELELQREQHLDPKTGLLNHSHLLGQLEQKLAEAGRQRPLSFLLVGIDDFGRINQEYGYAAGDGVLYRLSNILADMMAKEGVVGRFGDNEFGVVLPDKDGREAWRLAERLCRVAELVDFALEGRRLRVSLSIGVATYLEEARDSQELLRCAWSALEQAKRRTGNSICRYRELK